MADRNQWILVSTDLVLEGQNVAGLFQQYSQLHSCTFQRLTAVPVTSPTVCLTFAAVVWVVAQPRSHRP